MVVDDRVEVAGPVISRSPLLTDEDLIRVVSGGSTEHQVRVAQRPGIGEGVSQALVNTDAEAAVSALLQNATARIGKDAFSELVERSEAKVNLSQILAARPDIPPSLARRMCDWVSEELKQALFNRFPEEADDIVSVVDEASSSVRSGEQATSEISAAKLVAKLAASGQLRASFLIRALHQRQMELFDHGLATLLQSSVGEMRNVIYGERPVLLAYACRAAGIDRSVFGTVFNLSRHAKRLRTQITSADNAEIDRIFAKVSKADALERMKSLSLS